MTIIQSIPISGSGGSGSTYTNMTTDEAIAGTNTEERVISAKVLNDAIDNKIPTVNNAKLTIQKNGTTVKTFTANASSNVTCNIEIPTKVSDLANDSGFIVDVSDKADKATTLSGYGITDAYTKTQVDKKVSDLVNSAPETLDTLNELASALGNDPNFATTVTTQIGTKANDSNVVHKSGAETIDGTKTFSSNIVGNLTGNATKATNDSLGNKIDATYLKSIAYNSYSRNLILTKGDNTSSEFRVEHSNQAEYAQKDWNGNDIADTYATKSELTAKANDSDVVHKSGNETINGVKNFNDVVLGEQSGVIRIGNNEEGAHFSTLNYDGEIYNISKQFVPKTNNEYNLGTSANKWKDVYATTLHGDIDFPITEAQVNEILGIA